MLARISPLRVLFAALFLIGAVTHAQAGVITYTSRAVWEAAAPGSSTIGFEGIAAPGSFVAYDASGLTLDGVTFKATNGGLFVVDPAYDPAFYDWGSGAVLNVSRGPLDTVVVTVPVGTNAFGVDLMTFFDLPVSYGFDVLVTFPGFTGTVKTAAYPTRTFFGVVSDAPIGDVTFQMFNSDLEQPSPYLNLDDFSYASGSAPAPVPEPGTLLLLGSGLVGAARLRRRR